MPEHNFKIGDWITWRDNIDEKSLHNQKEMYGEGPFEIGDVRGDTLGIIHYWGAKHRPWWLRHETGFGAGWFKLSSPPIKEQQK